VATTLAHELNQPLGTIANYAEGCLTRIRQGAPNERALLDALEAITSEALRASGIIKRMRRFVSRRGPEHQALDVGDLVQEVVALLDLAARAASIRIRCTSVDSLPKASGDRVLVQQVILNLLRNAIEALAESQVADPVVGVHTSTNDERYIEIAVSDNGRGIPPDRLEGTFEAFFTTKKEGMGMGLPISRSIVQAHGGRLWARANPDRGITFYFTLPPAEPELDERAAKRA
jgi:signal transduction histidine kinase